MQLPIMNTEQIRTSATGRCGLLIMRMWPTVPICSGGKLSRNYVRRCKTLQGRFRKKAKTKRERQIDVWSRIRMLCTKRGERNATETCYCREKSTLSTSVCVIRTEKNYTIVFVCTRCPVRLPNFIKRSENKTSFVRNRTRCVDAIENHILYRNVNWVKTNRRNYSRVNIKYKIAEFRSEKKIFDTLKPLTKNEP